VLPTLSLKSRGVLRQQILQGFQARQLFLNAYQKTGEAHGQLKGIYDLSGKIPKVSLVKNSS